ncbi:MAG: DUF975 family protein [Erysipelotrichaceae bacterium]
MFNRKEIKYKARNEMNGKVCSYLLFFILYSAIVGIVNYYSSSSLIIDIATMFLLLNPLSVGLIKYYMNCENNTQKVSDILFAFKEDRYFNIVFIMAAQAIRIFLWALLFIIPGIIKSYEYYFIPYILAENPNISETDVFRLSNEYSKNIKIDIFIFQFSFVGWMFITIFTFGLASFWVHFYIGLSGLYLYKQRKANNNSEI